MKRLLLLCLVACLIAPLAAFATGSKEGEAKVTSAPADPFGKYSQPITITAVLAYREPERVIPAGITPENQKWIQLVKEKLNIDLKYKWIVPSDQFQQKWALAVSSGDLPDIARVDIRDFENFTDLGLLADLTSVYQIYATPWVKEMCENDGGFAMKSATKNGRMYGLPHFVDPYQQVQLLWYRQDWLAKLGLKVPTTFQDALEVMRAFAKKDPDGNGKDDTVGLGLQQVPFSWFLDLRGFVQAYRAYANAWIKDSSGKLVYSTILPEMKTALAALQGMYKDGILDKEFAVKNMDKVVEDVVAGRVGATFGEWWIPNWPLNMNKDNQKSAEWVASTIPTMDGKPVNHLIQRVWIADYCVVNKNCAYPEAAIKMINLFHDMDLNKDKYKGYTEFSDGYVYHWVPQYVYYAMTQSYNYKAVNEALVKGSLAGYTDYGGLKDLYDASVTYKKTPTDTKAWGLYYSRTAKDGGWGLSEPVRGSNLVVFNEFYGAPTKTMQDKGEALERLRDETFVKIIMGEQDLSAFDSYVASWKRLGGDEITKEVNDWYAKNK